MMIRRWMVSGLGLVVLAGALVATSEPTPPDHSWWLAYGELEIPLDRPEDTVGTDDTDDPDDGAPAWVRYHLTASRPPLDPAGKIPTERHTLALDLRQTPEPVTVELTDCTGRLLARHADLDAPTGHTDRDDWPRDVPLPVTFPCVDTAECTAEVCIDVLAASPTTMSGEVRLGWTTYEPDTTGRSPLDAPTVELELQIEER